MDRASRTAGFTLVELMITLGLVGALAVIVIPAYVHRAREAATSDAIGHLRTLFVGAASYYGAEHLRFASCGHPLWPCRRTHCSVRGATTPAAVEGAGVRLDDSGIASFEAIWLGADHPTPFQYSIRGATGRCQISPRAPVYTFAASGDLYADGERSRFELTVDSDETQHLRRSLGVYVVDAHE